MEIDRRPLEITRARSRSPRPINAACILLPKIPRIRLAFQVSRHSFSSSTQRLFTMRVNYSYYCWGTNTGTSSRQRDGLPMRNQRKCLFGQERRVGEGPPCCSVSIWKTINTRQTPVCSSPHRIIRGTIATA